MEETQSGVNEPWAGSGYPAEPVTKPAPELPAAKHLKQLANEMYQQAQLIAPATGRPDELPDIADQVRAEVLHEYAGRILAALDAK